MKIKLHTQGGWFTTPQTILVESSKIDRVYEDEGGALVCMNDERQYMVEETPDEIHDMIDDKPIVEKKEDKK